jgi:MFS transporter, MHS family, proline/betaine transporter
MNITKKAFLGAAFGTMIEYYDYALISIFLPILSPLFFPADSIYQSLVKGYYALMLTMLMRPIGGLLFGRLGDTLGRRQALLTSMYGIAFATLAIGVMPDCASWGMWATVLFMIAKSVQMCCFGGEYNGAGIYVVEHAKNHNEGLAGGLLAAMMLFGSLIASLLGILFTMEFMPAWSWRISFILGSVIGIFGIIYRKDLVESPVFKPANLKLQGFKSMLRKHLAELNAGFFIGGFATLPFTTVLTFINPVLHAKNHITSHELMISQTGLIVIAVVVLALSGKLADKYSSKTLMQCGCVLLIISAWPLLFLIDQGRWIFMAMAMFIIANEMLLASSNAYLKNLFPVEYRYRGASFSFCMGLSLIGGLTPIMENELYRLTGHFQIISIWLILISLGTLLSLNLVHRKHRTLSLNPEISNSLA